MRNLHLAVTFVVTLASGLVNATPLFAGSWTVDQGLSWMDLPLAYSGQEAAAALFGGSPTHYVISTIDSNPLNIDFMSWVSVWGAGFDKVAQGSKIDTGGLYQVDGDTSALVNDQAVGARFTNYSFAVNDGNSSPVPEPGSLALVVVGIVAANRRSRRRIG